MTENLDEELKEQLLSWGFESKCDGECFVYYDREKELFLDTEATAEGTRYFSVTTILGRERVNMTYYADTNQIREVLNSLFRCRGYVVRSIAETALKALKLQGHWGEE